MALMLPLPHAMPKTIIRLDRDLPQLNPLVSRFEVLEGMASQVTGSNGQQNCRSLFNTLHDYPERRNGQSPRSDDIPAQRGQRSACKRVVRGKGVQFLARYSWFYIFHGRSGNETNLC
jgi:hypothetical protein